MARRRTTPTGTALALTGLLGASAALASGQEPRPGDTDPRVPVSHASPVTATDAARGEPAPAAPRSTTGAENTAPSAPPGTTETLAPPILPSESRGPPEAPPPLQPAVTDAPIQDTAPPSPAVPPRALRPFIPHGEPDTNAPLSGGTWAAHGGLTLLPLGTAWAATRAGGDTRLGAVAAESAVGTLVASFPGRFLFTHPSYPQGRWTELEVGAFGAAFVVTPPLTALGSWGLGEVAFGRSERPGRAYLGALGGAAAGMLLGVAAHEGLKHLAGSSERLNTLRRYIAFACIGTGSTLGYQWSRTPTPRR